MNFRASAFPQPESPNMSTGYGQVRSTPNQQPVQGNQMLQLVQAMLQAQTQQGAQRGAQQREMMNPVRLGMSGLPIDQTTGKEAGNAFDTGFFLSPQARMDKIGAMWNAKPPQAPGMQPMGQGVPSPTAPPSSTPGGFNVPGYGLGPQTQPLKPRPRTGASFGFSASPRPGFSM